MLIGGNLRSAFFSKCSKCTVQGKTFSLPQLQRYRQLLSLLYWSIFWGVGVCSVLILWGQYSCMYAVTNVCAPLIISELNLVCQDVNCDKHNNFQRYRVMNTANVESINITRLSNDNMRRLINGLDTIITDCDGVLWIENTPIQGSVEVVNKLKSIGKRVLLLTNNSIKNRNEFLTKAVKMGFQVEMEDIVTTAYLVALYLKNINFDKKAYVIGSKGIITELESVGIRHLGYGPDVLQNSLAQTIESFSPDPDVGAVIVGFDEHFCYTKLLKAASYLNKPECLFLATNANERLPIDSTLVMPGTGSILKSIEAVTQREAVILGKPFPFLGEALKNKFNIDPDRTMLIGDRCHTDIEQGSTLGYQTMLVMSGAANFLSMNTAPLNMSHIPDYYIKTLGGLLPCLRNTTCS